MPEVIQYKCPHCGGRVEFDSETQSMKCPYCDSDFDINEATIEKENDSQVIESENQTRGLKTYICKSCGGEIITEENTSATACPFCDNPVILSEQVNGEFLPKKIIPFKVSKEMAKNALSEHYKDKPYLPDMFTDKNHLDEIKGVYVPYWIYNTLATAQINYECHKVRKSRRNARGGHYEITDTAIYDVMRKGQMQFQNVPVDASKKMDDNMMDSVEPFDFSTAVPFETGYLSGYSADKYDETNETLKNRVDKRIKNGSIDAMRNIIQGYDTKQTTNAHVLYNQTEDPYYMLCPVWILNTTFNGENHRFIVNGQTGKIVGKLPIDKKKRSRMSLRDFSITTMIFATLITIMGILFPLSPVSSMITVLGGMI